MGDINNPALMQARPTLLFAGSEDVVMAGRLLELLIHESVSGMYRCEALFNNWGTADGGVGYLLFDRSILDFGKTFEVKLSDTTMFSGKITAIQADYPNGAPPQIRILAEDSLQNLRMTRRTRSFNDLSDAQAIQQIAQGHGLTPQVNISGSTHKIIAQVNQSDLAFMRERARAVGAEIWLEGQTLHAAPRTQRGATAIRANIFKAADRFNSRGEKINGNGLAAAGAIVRRGRKVLLDLDRYGAWLAGRAG